MKRKRTIFLIIVITLIAAFACASLFGCATPKGHAWLAADGSAPAGFPDAVEFFDDSICSVDGMSAIYQFKKNTLMLSAAGQISLYRYSMPDEATLYLQDGTETVRYRLKEAALSSMSTEVPESVLPVHVAATYQRYIEDVLLPQYGYFHLSSHSHVLQDGTSAPNTEYGIASVGCANLDGDDVPEMIAVTSKKREDGTLIMDIHAYKQVDGVVTELERNRENELPQSDNFSFALLPDSWSEMLLCAFESNGEQYLMRYLSYQRDSGKTSFYSFYRLMNGRLYEIDELRVDNNTPVLYNNIPSLDYEFTYRFLDGGKMCDHYGVRVEGADGHQVFSDHLPEDAPAEESAALSAQVDAVVDEALSLYSIQRTLGDDGTQFTFAGESTCILRKSGPYQTWQYDTTLLSNIVD